MEIKKAVIVCDFCGKEVVKPFVRTSDVPNEGASEISMGKKSFYVNDGDYCDLSCLFDAIKKELATS